MKKKDVRLYNVLFPIWFFYLMPSYFWLLILAVNFVIDSLVLVLSARRQGLDSRALYKKAILPVWGIGFVSDFIGAVLIYLLYVCAAALAEFLPSFPNLIRFPWTTLISIPGTVLAGNLIYKLNREMLLRRCDLTPEDVHRLSLRLALFTAPYAMLIPMYG